MQKSISPTAIIHRTALPLMLFFAVFVSMLFLSKSFLLPALLTVEIDGEKHSVEEIQSYHDVIAKSLDEKQSQRTKLLLPMEGTVYRNILDEKNKAYTLDFLTNSLEKIAEQISTMQKSENIVSIQHLEYMPMMHSLRIVGKISGVGPRSMTVLARYTEELRRQSFVADLNRPAFIRKEDGNGAFYSPFDISLSLE